jgi:hypothetical protein
VAEYLDFSNHISRYGRRPGHPDPHAPPAPSGRRAGPPIELVNTFQNALRFPVSVSLLLLKSPLLLCVALLLLYALSDPLSLLRKLFGIARPFVIRSSGGHPGRA